MRGGGGHEVAMTNAGSGCWYTDVPLAAGANQYWFYVNGNRYRQDPRALELTDRKEIAIVIGTPPPEIPKTADFSKA